MRPRSSILIGAAAVAVTVAAIAAAAPEPAAGHSIELAVKDRASANASVAALGRFVALAWSASAKDGVTDIYLATSRDAGQTFGAPVRVNDVPGEARVSGEQPPRVALVARLRRDPAVVLVWTAKAAAGTRLLTTRSGDGGRTFARATIVPGGEAAGNRGWETTTTDRDGRVVALWLDHRELAGPGAPMHHDGQAHTGAARPIDGAARAESSKLYFARLDGSDNAQALTGGVCYCCKTALAAGPDGSLYAAWRHVYPGNVRDIAFTVSRDGGRSFAAPLRVSDDRWVLDGCPENGPAMAVDAGNRVHLIWPTLVSGAAPDSEPSLALFYAASADGRQFTPRERITTEGVPRHPQLATAANGSLVAAWDEQLSGTRQVVVGRAMPGGRHSAAFSREVLSSRGPAAAPAIAVAADGVVVAWTSGSADASVIRVGRFQ